MSSSEIAKIILQQLSSKKVIFWSWGSNSFKTIEQSKMFFNEEYSHYGGLLFKVEGKKFVGHVAIVLSPMDTYIIKFGHLKKNQWVDARIEDENLNLVEQKAIDYVYNDQLHEIIDRFVET